MPWITAAASIGGSLLGASAAGKGSYAQRLAADQAIALQRENQEYAKKLLQPYNQAGTDALSKYQGILSGGLDDYSNSSFFQNYLDQANRNLLSNQAVTGGLRGGNTAGLLSQVQPNLANQLRQQDLSNYAQLIGVGGSAAGGLVNSLTGANTNIGNQLNQLGSNQAAGYIDQGSNYGNLLSKLLIQNPKQQTSLTGLGQGISSYFGNLFGNNRGAVTGTGAFDIGGIL